MVKRRKNRLRASRARSRGAWSGRRGREPLCARPWHNAGEAETGGAEGQAKGLATRESISEQRTRGRRYTPAGDPWDGLGGAIWRIKAPARCTTRHAPEGILRYLFQFYPPPIQLIQDSAESFKLGKHRGNTRTRMGKISQQERVGVGWCACPMHLTAVRPGFYRPGVLCACRGVAGDVPGRWRGRRHPRITQRRQRGELEPELSSLGGGS